MDVISRISIISSSNRNEEELMIKYRFHLVYLNAANRWFKSVRIHEIGSHWSDVYVC